MLSFDKFSSYFPSIESRYVVFFLPIWLQTFFTFIRSNVCGWNFTRYSIIAFDYTTFSSYASLNVYGFILLWHALNIFQISPIFPGLNYSIYTFSGNNFRGKVNLHITIYFPPKNKDERKRNGAFTIYIFHHVEILLLPYFHCL